MTQPSLDFYFDLTTNGLNYGIVYSLSLVETERRRLGVSNCRVAIVPTDEEDGFGNRTRRDKTYDVGQKEWRLHNLVLPATRLIPSVRGLTVPGRRDEVRAMLKSNPFRFPANYSIDNPTKNKGSFQMLLEEAKKGADVQHIRAPKFALQSMKLWLDKVAGTREVVTITLRQSDIQAQRNSDTQAWLELAKHIERKGMRAVFLCDTELLLTGRPGLPGGFARCNLASLNLELRCALYELAALNYYVSNGPLSVALCDKKISYISCKWLVDGYNNTSQDFFTQIGLLPEGQMPGRQNPYGEILWESDESQVLIDSFDRWLDMRPTQTVEG